jgi:hypothetical protein
MNSSVLPVIPIIDSPPGEEPAVVSALANPSSGRLMVQGWEKHGAATAVLDVSV